MIKRVFLIVLLSISYNLSAQDTLNLLSGKSKLIQADTMDFDFFYYHKIKKDGTLGKQKKKNLDHIFSVDYKKGGTKYIYQKDTMFDNFFSVREMEYYLEGRRQARKNYRPYKTLIMGAGLGTGIALYSLFPIKYGEKVRVNEVLDTVTNSIVNVTYYDAKAITVPIPYWELIPLGIFTYYQGSAKNTKSFKADDMEMFKSEAFMVGYKETVINRKVLAAVGSSIGSYFLTMLGYITFDPIQK